MANETSLISILKDAKQHCFEMQRIAETKNAALIAFNGAMIIAASRLYLNNDSLFVGFKIYLGWTILLCLLSIFTSLLSILPRMIHVEMNMSNKQSENLTFFGSIANYNSDKYLTEVKNKYNLTSENPSYELDLSKQAVVNAQIALRKFRFFTTAVVFCITGFLTPIATLLYFSIFSNNK